MEHGVSPRISASTLPRPPQSKTVFASNIETWSWITNTTSVDKMQIGMFVPTLHEHTVFSTAQVSIGRGHGEDFMHERYTRRYMTNNLPGLVDQSIGRRVKYRRCQRDSVNINTEPVNRRI